MGYIVAYDRNISLDVPNSYKRVTTCLENAGVDYFNSLKEAKECADTKKKVVNRDYFNIRVYQGSEKDFQRFCKDTSNQLEIVYRPL